MINLTLKTNKILHICTIKAFIDGASDSKTPILIQRYTWTMMMQVTILILSCRMYMTRSMAKRSTIQLKFQQIKFYVLTLMMKLMTTSSLATLNLKKVKDIGITSSTRM